MRRARGKMVLSINDNADVRAIFAGLNLLPLRTTYTIGTASGGAKDVGELVIANVDLPASATP